MEIRPKKTSNAYLKLIKMECRSIPDRMISCWILENLCPSRKACAYDVYNRKELRRQPYWINEHDSDGKGRLVVRGKCNSSHPYFLLNLLTLKICLKTTSTVFKYEGRSQCWGKAPHVPAGSHRVMGNQLSTWNLTIQSAVAGENFNYNPNYNQVTPPGT